MTGEIIYMCGPVTSSTVNGLWSNFDFLIQCLMFSLAVLYFLYKSDHKLSNTFRLLIKDNFLSGLVAALVFAWFVHLFRKMTTAIASDNILRSLSYILTGYLSGTLIGKVKPPLYFNVRQHIEAYIKEKKGRF